MESLNFHPIENSSDTAEIVVPILIEKYHPKSVLDLGCNTGQWLKWFIQNGITDVIGVDGDNMRGNLVTYESSFISHDLTKYLDLRKKFGLVLCLEVAEHLDEQYADILVDTAVRHSDTIFWSAATPGQTGYNHVNEQPLMYWVEKFNDRGYYGKFLSNKLPILPHDYYRKNAISFTKFRG